MNSCRELYDRVKREPNAIVMDVGEEHPFIIHEAHAHVTYKDGTQGEKVLYATFEYVKKHLKKFKACPCASCQNAVAAYRLNKKTMRMAKPENIVEFVPGDWVRADH